MPLHEVVFAGLCLLTTICYFHGTMLVRAEHLDEDV